MSRLPKARRDNLVVQELDDEVLVYDQESDQAHCLNQTAAMVWRHCDGQTSVLDIATRMGTELQATVDERVVWFALRQLERDRLLDEVLPVPALISGMTRRQLVRSLGLAAAVGIPLITSILAPTTAHAVSCLANGQPCPGGPTTCCSNVCSAPGNICGS